MDVFSACFGIFIHQTSPIVMLQFHDIIIKDTFHRLESALIAAALPCEGGVGGELEVVKNGPGIPPLA